MRFDELPDAVCDVLEAEFMRLLRRQFDHDVAEMHGDMMDEFLQMPEVVHLLEHYTERLWQDYQHEHHYEQWQAYIAELGLTESPENLSHWKKPRPQAVGCAPRK